MSIDSRLRNSLHGAAAAVTPDTASALREVRRRATRHRRTVFVARIAVAAAVTAVVIIFGTGPIAVDRLRAPEQVAPAAPASLVGTYVVDVAEGEASYMHDMIGRWVVTLRADGVVEFEAPDGYPHNALSGTYRIEDDLFRTNLFSDVPGCRLGGAGATYRWVSTAGELRFFVVSGTCMAQQVLFIYQPWKESP